MTDLLIAAGAGWVIYLTIMALSIGAVVVAWKLLLVGDDWLAGYIQKLDNNKRGK